MVSTRTTNRQRKVQYLRDSLNIILDLLMSEHKSRENINMGDFKELQRQLEDMKRISELGVHK